MRVLLFRNLCDMSGISRWMIEHGQELKRQGVGVEYWFCTPSPAVEEYRAIAPTTVAPMVELMQRLERDPYDVVHVSSVDAAAEVLPLVNPRPKIVTTHHGAFSESWTSENCFACVGVSKDSSRVEQPLTDLLVETVVNGIDPARFSAPTAFDEGKPIVAFAGRTTDIRRKDFPRFTRIVNELDLDTVRIWVADARGGDWDRLPKDKTVRVPVERWSQVPHDEMVDFYRAIAASGGTIVMTSPAEGFPGVAAEGSACGVPIIGPDVIGVRQAVIDGVTGVLYPYEATDADVARIIERVLADGKRDIADVERRSQTALTAFSLAVETRKYIDIYERSQPILAPKPLPAFNPREQGVHVMVDTLYNFRVIRARHRARLITEFLDAGRTDYARLAFALTLRQLRKEMLHKDVRRSFARSALRIMARVVRRPAKA